MRELEEQRQLTHQARDRLLDNALTASAAIADAVRAAQQQIPAIAANGSTETDHDPGETAEHELISA